MSKNKTTKQFIEDAQKIHNNKYDYSLVEYKSAKTKIKIICPIHTMFEQKPDCHLSGSGCPMCNKSYKLNNESFIQKSKIIHNDKYNYSLVEYSNNNTKIKIICPIHNIFEQTPRDHLKGAGCQKCKFKKLRNLYSLTTDEFIKKSKDIHSNKYDYSLVEYKNIRTNVKIICPTHGIFEQTPNKHLKNRGCQFCGGTHKKTTEQFIQESIKIHGDKYDYSLVEYINGGTEVEIICPIHKIFKQKPHKHLLGHDCPHCNESKGENKIKIFLNKNNIVFERQKIFNGCKNIKNLKFDFYLPDHNICIEFDGEQHFKSVKCFGGDDRLKYIKINDEIKNKYCIENNIKLIRIKYNDNLIKILTENLIHS